MSASTAAAALALHTEPYLIVTPRLLSSPKNRSVRGSSTHRQCGGSSTSSIIVAFRLSSSPTISNQYVMATTVNRKHASQSSSRRRTRLPWRTSTYDDEKLLRTILAQNLIASWRSIHQRYNDAAPATRQRSVDAVTSKGKEIYRQHRLQSSTYWCEDFIPQSSNESSESSIVQDNPVFPSGQQMLNRS